MRHLLLFLALSLPLFAGKLTKHQFSSSKIFPGTQRDYWIYLPDQYDPAKPAALMVFQDGGSFVRKPGTSGYIPDVFDQLIASGDMPVTIGLFVNPGVIPAPREGAQPRFNRSYEYDSMGPNYANFLIDELIPTLDLNISNNPDDRAICGASSGAIAAFTVAWERPDQFRRVYSMIGTYVGLRGRPSFARLSPSPSVSSCKVDPMTSTSTPATGGWPTRPCNAPSPSPATSTPIAGMMAATTVKAETPS